MRIFGGRQGVLALAAAVGLVLIVLGILSQRPDPPAAGPDQGSLDPSATTSTTDSGAPAPSAEADDSPAEADDPPPLGPSRPLSVSVPAIEVASDLLQLGTTDDGTLAVPQPGPDLDKAAWLEDSPTPGQPGPSVIEGHVSTAENGPSIFFDLAELEIGDKIDVRREDGTRVEFTVYATREFDKDSFPTKLVYGGDLGTPTLRLVTCSSFDPDIGHHTGNLVVFSRLTDVREG
ncbi:MAG: sortase [Nocardioides sp.]|nr:sortase [Nocardioides sp.]